MLQYGQYPYNSADIPAGYCTAPSGFNASLNGDIVTLSWVPAHAVLYFTLSIKLADNTPVWSGNINASRYITQLLPNTNYKALLETICDDDPVRTGGAPLEITFTTGAHVVQCMPVNLSLVLATMRPDSVLLSWPANADALAFSVFYKIKNSLLPFEKIATQTNTVSIPLLVPKTEYEYYIITHCKDGKTAESDKGVFITPVDITVCPPPEVSAVVTGNTAVVVWKYTGLHSTYDVYLNSLLHIANYPSNLINLYDLNPLTEYNVAVVGRCADGNSIAGTFKFTTGGLICVKPTNLTVNIVGQTGTISWTPVAGVSEYDVVINGSLQTVSVPTVNVTIIPNAIYDVQVFSKCGSGNSAAATLRFVGTDTCLPVPLANIVTTATPTSITLDWPDMPGVVKYRYRYRLSPAGAWGNWVTTYNSEVIITGLTPSTGYDVEIENTCANKQIVSAIKTANTSGLIVVGKPTITGFTNITDNGFCVNFTVPSGNLVGTFVAKVKDIVTNITVEHAGTLTTICVTGKVQHRNYEVIIEDRQSGYTVLPSDPSTVETCYTCAPVAGLTAVFNGTNIDVAYTAATGADSYKIFSRAAGTSDDWTEETTISGTSYTIVKSSLEYLEIKVQSIYNDCNTSCETSINMTCVKVSGLTAEINGTVGNLSWTPIANAHGYKVKLTSLAGGTIEEFTNDPFIAIDDFLPDTTYSYTVEGYCTTDDLGAVSDPFVFNTGASTPVENTCPEAIFTATSQDSSIADPETPDGGTVDNSAPATVNFTTYYGDSFDRSMVFKNSAGTPINITGYTFELKVFPIDSLLNILLTFTSADGSVVNGGVTGQITLLKTPAQMSSLSVGVYEYTMKWINTSNVVKTILQGSFTVLEANPA